MSFLFRRMPGMGWVVAVEDVLQNVRAFQEDHSLERSGEELSFNFFSGL